MEFIVSCAPVGAQAQAESGLLFTGFGAKNKGEGVWIRVI